MAKVAGMEDIFGYFRTKRDVLRKRWIKAMQEQDLLAGLTTDVQNTASAQIYDMYIQCLETTKYETAKDYAKTLREQVGLSSAQLIMGMLLLKDIYERAIFERYGKEPKELAGILSYYEPIANGILGIVTTTIVTDAEQRIRQQQEALLELSTPVIKIWEKVLTVPLIGILDSPRTQLVMETLLQRIVDTQSRVVILDISGIPGIDPMVANHLIRTVAATKLLGAECIITGISSKIAQTLVHLGVDLSAITTRSSMSDGIAMAFEILGLQVVSK